LRRKNLFFEASIRVRVHRHQQVIWGKLTWSA